MSWLEDEWKDELPRAALDRITSMEANLEKLNKDIKQYQHKTESLEANSSKARKDLEDEIKSHLETQRDKLSFERRFNDLLTTHERLVDECKGKQLTIDRLNEQVDKLLDTVNEKTEQITNLLAELESFRCEYEQLLRKNMGDIGGINDASIFNQQRIEDFKAHVQTLTKEKQDLKVQYLEDARRWDHERDTYNVIVKNALDALDGKKKETEARNHECKKLFEALELLRESFSRAESSRHEMISSPPTSASMDSNEVTDLKVVHENLKAEANELRQRLSTVSEECEATKITASNLRAESEDLNLILQESDDEKRDLQQQIVVAERTIENLRLEKSIMEKTIAELQEQEEDWDQDKRNLLNEIVRLKKVEQDLEFQLADANICAVPEPSVLENNPSASAQSIVKFDEDFQGLQEALFKSKSSYESQVALLKEQIQRHVQVLTQKDQIIHHQESIIRSKEAIIVQKDTLIGDKQSIIDARMANVCDARPLQSNLATQDYRRQQQNDQLFLEVLELRRKVSELEKANRNSKRQSTAHVRSVTTLRTEFESDAEQKMHSDDGKSEKEYVLKIDRVQIDDDSDVITLCPSHSKSSVHESESRPKTERFALKELQRSLEEKFAEERHRFEEEIHKLKRELKDRERQLFFTSSDGDKFKMPYQTINVNPVVSEKYGWKITNLKGTNHLFGQDGVQDSGVSLSGESQRQITAGSSAGKQRVKPKEDSFSVELGASPVPNYGTEMPKENLPEVGSNSLCTPQKSSLLLRGNLESRSGKSDMVSSSNATAPSTFEHGEHCKSLWHQLQAANATTLFSEEERQLLSTRLQEMEAKYNSHMVECSAHQKEVEAARLAVQSMEKIAVDGYVQQEGVVTELQRKLLNEQEKCRRMEVCLRQAQERVNHEGARVASKCSKVESNERSETTTNLWCWDRIEDKLDRVLVIMTGEDQEISVHKGEAFAMMASELRALRSHFREEISEGNKKVVENFEEMLERLLSTLSRSSIKASISTRHQADDRKHKLVSSLENCQSDFADSKYALHLRQDVGGAVDDLERVKCRITTVQQNVLAYAAKVRSLEEDRDRLQDELLKMVDVLKKKEEENRLFEGLIEREKLKVEENNSCFRSEMEALKAEQLEIYQEFREMCENLKKKDIELLNKTKQMKLLSAEWRETEDSLQETIQQLQVENSNVLEQKNELQAELEQINVENGLIKDKLGDREKNLQKVFDGLTHIERVFLEARKSGLYR